MCCSQCPTVKPDGIQSPHSNVSYNLITNRPISIDMYGILFFSLISETGDIPKWFQSL